MTDIRTDKHVLRQGQHVSLSELDDARTVSFAVVDVEGREVAVRTTGRVRTPFPVGTEVRLRFSVIDDASYQGLVTLADHADQDGCPEYRFTVPEDLDRLQARNFRRLALLADDVAATVGEVDGSGSVAGRLIDISAGGAGLLTGGELVVGGRYRLSCSLEGGGLSVDADVEVVRESEDGSQYGLRFVGLRPAMEDKIVAFVLRQGVQRS